MVRKVLVTGGCGFIGCNFVRHLLASRDDLEVVNFDKLTYAGNPENLADLESHPRYTFVKGDIADASLVGEWFAKGLDIVVNFAAESHVDRSIMDSTPFVHTNVLGTQVLLDAARKHGVGVFIHISTDEVYGSLGERGKFREDSPLAPNSPYAASKAAADLLARAFHKTFEVPAIITRSCNNYGPYQFPEKLIPLFVSNALEDKKLPLYGDGLNVRDWLYVEDHCAALLAVMERGVPGEIYNISAGEEATNINLTRMLLQYMNKPESLITFVADRPAHDRRYALDASKITSVLGWQPAHKLSDGLKKTVEWYVCHRQWWERIKSGAYRDYYRKQYGDLT